jgi:hypothetical protein
MAFVTPWYAYSVTSAPPPPANVVASRPREVGGLAPGVHEQDGVQAGRHRRHEPFGELQRRPMEIARVRVQGAGLARDRLDDARVRVSDDLDVVVRVEVLTPLGVGHPRSACAHDMQRALIGQRRDRRPQQPPPLLHELLCRGHRTAPALDAGIDGLADPRAPPLEPKLVEDVEHRPRTRVPPRDVLRGLGVRAHPPGRDGDARRPPRQQQLGEDVDLLVLERRHRVKPGHHRGERVAMVRSFADERLGRRDQVAHDGAVPHVPEVEDPADLLIVREQRVVKREVVVDHLRSQALEDGLDVFPVVVEDALDDRPASRVLEIADELAQSHRVLQIPQQWPRRRGMEEPAQRPAQARRGRAERAHGVLRQLLGLHVPAGHERDDADDVRTSLAVLDGRAEAPVERRLDPHHRQLRIGPGDVEHGLRLHVDDAGVLGRVADLQHPAGSVVDVDPEVLIALADERRRTTADPEVRRGDRLGLVPAEGGNLGLEGVVWSVEGVGHGVVDAFHAAPAVDASAKRASGGLV